MATKKQERRWFRVADSVGRERWSNDEAALFLRLLAYLNTRRIRDDLTPDEAVVVLLGPAELAHLAGCQSLVRARRTLGALAVHLGLTWSARGADTLVAWPKVAEVQGWRRPNSTRETPLPTPTPTPTPRLLLQTPSESSEEHRGAAAAAPARAARRRSKPRPPEASRPDPFAPERPVPLSDDTAAAIASLHGHDPEAVRRWWAYTWPTVCSVNAERAPGNRYRDPQAVARRWWTLAVRRGDDAPFVASVRAEREAERKARLRREADAALAVVHQRLDVRDREPAASAAVSHEQAWEVEVIQ